MDIERVNSVLTKAIVKFQEDEIEGLSDGIAGESEAMDKGLADDAKVKKQKEK